MNFTIMKTRIYSVAVLLALATFFSACGGDDDDATPGGNEDIGTFAGNIQITDDPQTELGYILNVKIKVTRNGNNATIKITGDPGFDREYTGSFTTLQTGLYDIKISKQIKPSEKIAGERVVISDNKLTIGIDVANDNVLVRTNPNTAETVQISGKLEMIGTDLLKE
jgi:hypothetical protein